MKVAFRVDGNNEIGIGHIMRCTALAIKLRQHGALCQFFISKDTKINETVKGYGFEYIKLNSDYKNIDNSVNEMNLYINKNKYDYIVIDSYFVTNLFFNNLNQKIKTIYITESFPEQTNIVCDFFLNYNLYLNNYTPPTKEKTQFLLGSKYCLIRDEFKDCHYNTKNKDILILAGGTDPLNCIELITEYLLAKDEINGYSFVLVTSKNKKSIENFKKTYRNNKRVKVVIEPQYISNIMGSCCLAISAAGSSLYEIFACGTSAISYSFVDNQEKIAEAFSNNKLIEYAGRINDEPHKTLNNIAKFIILKGKNNNITNQNEIINIDGAELVASILFDELNTYDGA